MMPLPSYNLLGALNRSCIQPNAVSLRFADGAPVNGVYSVCDGLGTEQNTEGAG